MTRAALAAWCIAVGMIAMADALLVLINPAGAAAWLAACVAVTLLKYYG